MVAQEQAHQGAADKGQGTADTALSPVACRLSPDAPGPARYRLPAYRPLLGRGISPATLAAFEVAWGRWAGEEGWLYPVYGPGRALLGCRFKSAARRPRYKYGWVESRESASAVLYGAGCVQRARPVVLCAGEPDAWLLHTLGVPGCTFLRGEGAAAPLGAIAELAARAPSLVLVAYDRDDVGSSGAPRHARALRDAGLRARALELPSDLPEGGDLCDLFARRSRERTAFMAALAGCRDLAVPPPQTGDRRWAVGGRTSGTAGGRVTTGARNGSTAYRLPPTAYRLRRGPWEDFNAAHDLVAMVHEVVRLKRSGTSWVGLCPFHGESTPSFHVYRTHYYCYGCRRRGDAYDFDRWLKGEA